MVSIIPVSIYDIRMAMIQWTFTNIALLVLLILSLAFSAFRMAKFGKRHGYNPWIIFFISFFTTAIPITLYFHLRHRATGIDQLPTLSSRMKHRNRRLQDDQDRENEENSR